MLEDLPVVTVRGGEYVAVGVVVLIHVAVTLSAIDFSNPPTVMALVGHARGEALFSDVNVAYASETGPDHAGLVVTIPTSSPIILDRPMLAAIWSGAVSTWEEPAIAALNGGSWPLEGNITLVVTNHTMAADEHAGGSLL